MLKFAGGRGKTCRLWVCAKEQESVQKNCESMPKAEKVWQSVT